MKTPHTKSIDRSPLRYGFCLIPFAFVCLAVLPQARAVCQDGCLANSNTVLGDDALINNTGLGWNTAIGFNALLSNTNGFGNTAVGYVALSRNTGGYSNTAVGYNALPINTTGSQNTANGVSALSFNTTGDNNIAVGGGALGMNTTGDSNTATGAFALEFNTTASFNTAHGSFALYNNTTGNNNTAIGYQALDHNTTSSENTASGANTLFTNKTGSQNTADGSGALYFNRFGNFNTAIGRNALYNNKTGASNIALGNNAGFNITGGQNIDIGNDGVAAESATIRIGSGNQTNAYIAGISGATVPGGVGVIVDSSGHLGTTTSSARFKEAIKPMEKASETILALKPVTFRYKHEVDPDGIRQFGLVAEEVEKVSPDLVARDAEGKPYSVRYEAVNAMLLNEFLKEHRKNEKQEATIAQLQQQVAALTAGLQKVSTQLELNKRAPQTASNN